MLTNVCCDCGIEKPLSEYYPLEPHACMVCKRGREKRYRQSEKGREYIRKYNQIRYWKFKDKNVARAKTRAAVQSGKLIKPDTCEGCNNQFKPKEIHAHHDDYTKPLEVRWFCGNCHKHVHGKLVDLSLIAKSNLDRDGE